MTHSLLAMLGIWLLTAWVFDASTLGDAFWNPAVQSAVEHLQPLTALHALAPTAVTPFATAAIEGYGAHLLCDMMTVQGVKLFYGMVFLPKSIRRRRYRIASIRTGSPAEDRYVVAVARVHVVLFVVYVILFVITPFVYGGVPA